MNEPDTTAEPDLDPIAEAILQALASDSKPAVSAERVCRTIQAARAGPADGPQAGANTCVR